MIASKKDTIRWLLMLPLVLAACSVDPKANDRYDFPKCPKGQMYRGFCKEPRDASVSAPKSDAASGDGSAMGSGGSGNGNGGAGGKGSDDAGSGQDLTGKSCVGATMAVYCYLGPKDSDGVGICHGGHRDCVNGKWTECLGEVRPAEKEDCNGIDDDCDGEKDNDVPPTPCPMCGTNECVHGHNVCKQGVVPHEVCNGKDDDCDGDTDEDTATPCVDGNSGCTESGGVIACKGICHWGTKTCQDGKLSATCEGQVMPKAKDGCNTGVGLNDDCDDSIDEDCSCTPGTSVPCYAGAAETLNGNGEPMGECKKGTQQCGSNSKYGACDGEQGPKDEDCTNMGHDDDCDGKMDEGIPGFGDACPTSMSGECKTGIMQCMNDELECIGPPMMDEVCNKLDDDCDGYIDEEFDLSTDPTNCGACGKKCDPGQSCCTGMCTDTTSDPKNCNGCNMPCGTSVACCNSSCRNLLIEKNNCGMCGHGCGTNENCCGGICTPINTAQHCGNCNTKCTGLAPGCCAQGSSFSCGALGVGCL